MGGRLGGLLCDVLCGRLVDRVGGLLDDRWVACSVIFWMAGWWSFEWSLG